MLRKNIWRAACQGLLYGLLVEALPAAAVAAEMPQILAPAIMATLMAAIMAPTPTSTFRLLEYPIWASMQVCGAKWFSPRTIPGIRIFPARPVDPNSDAIIATIGADEGMHPDFGSGNLYLGTPIGIPYVIVSGSQTTVPVTFQTSDESDPFLSYSCECAC